MLARPQRLHQERDIVRVLRHGRRRSDALLQLIVAAGTVPRSRVAVITSKQVGKKAILRNQIRRRIQALLPKQLANQSTPLDIIIRVSPPAAKATQAALKTSLTTLWPTHAFRPSAHHSHTPRVPARPLPRS